MRVPEDLSDVGTGAANASSIVAIQDELLDMVLASAGIPEIIRVLATRLGNPVALGDPLFHLLASWPSTEHGDAHRREAVQRKGTPRNVLDDPVVGALFREVAETRRSVHFPSFPDHGMDLPRLMTPVLAGDEILGFLTVLEEHPFLPGLQTLLERAAKVVAVELLTRRVESETELHLMTDFLGDLLFGRIADRESLVRRAGFLGVDLFRSWNLLIVDADDLEGLTLAAKAPNPVVAIQLLFEVAARFVRSAAPRSIAIVQSDSIVILLPVHSRRGADATDPRTLAGRLQSEIARSFSQTVSIAVSGTCSTLEDFPIKYFEARRALDIASARKQVSAIVSLEDFGLYGLLFRRDDQEYLERFLQQTLGPLITHDANDGSHLVDTLRMYLEHGAALRATARRMKIHPNTLRARLARIEVITGLDLSSARTRTELWIAMEIATAIESAIP